jgi:hypothetical protein
MKTISKKNMIFDFNIVLCVLLIFFIPNFINVVFALSSYSIGIFIASIIVIALNFRLGYVRVRYVNFLVIFAVLFALFIFSLYIFFSIGETKPLYSLIPLAASIFAAIFFAEHVKATNYKALENSIFIVIIVLILLGWLDVVFPVTCCNYISRFKSVFPFTEESHYALAFGVLAIAYSIGAKKSRVFFIGGNTLILSLVYPSLTLLLVSLFCFFASTFRMKRSRFFALILVLPLLVFFIGMPIIISNQYFADRLRIQGTLNLTALVFLQGWQLSYSNFVGTQGMGVGFQMLGLSNNPSSLFSDTIFNIYGKQFNVMDGGFLAAKLISEFGFLGIAITLFYLFFILRFIFFTNKIWKVAWSPESNVKKSFLKKKTLLLGMVFAFFIELFFRSPGYFSPSFFIAMVALISSYRMPKLNNFSQ